MKFKLFMGIALVAVATMVCLWLKFSPSLQSAARSSLVKSPDLAIQPSRIPANAPKLVTVARQPGEVSTSGQALPVSDWGIVQKIMNTQAGYEERMDAINSLSPSLTGTNWGMLQKFLLQPDSLDRSQLGQVLKNRLLDVLCAMSPPPAGLSDVLAQMYRDDRQNEVIRNYAVQHMGAYYEQISIQPGGSPAQPAVQKVLWEAAQETSDSIGGTALLALKRLSQEYPEFDQGKVASTALQMAGATDAGELTHITAYQVCAQLGVSDALPVVLAAAQNGETISVRMSAIGALGPLGGPEQIPFLNSVLTGTEDRLKPAAQHALEQIAARQTHLASQK